mmetsp:Transcript_39585/g.67419  ORF Transcript_39585/g.67419 Transcript_39585/m.67419 type:complete len:185 (-) Transcript_39585:1148-1702(-)
MMLYHDNTSKSLLQSHCPFLSTPAIYQVDAFHYNNLKTSLPNPHIHTPKIISAFIMKSSVGFCINLSHSILRQHPLKPDGRVDFSHQIKNPKIILDKRISVTLKTRHQHSRRLDDKLICRCLQWCSFHFRFRRQRPTASFHLISSLSSSSSMEMPLFPISLSPLPSVKDILFEFMRSMAYDAMI